MKKIAIQGEAGSFHEIAAHRYFGSDVELVCCQTFPEVFAALHNGEADMAVVAIGNSRYGDIDHVYDVLISNHLKKEAVRYWIAGEVYIEISQCLLGVKGSGLETIKEVHSQAPALGQCFDFLHDKLPGVLHVEQEDTALSAKLVAKWNDKTKAAIASKTAAELHGLEVLAEGIQDDNVNVTRFLVLAPHPAVTNLGFNKTSLLMKTSHQPGSLAKALVLFSDLDINLSYLQSVPIPKQPFQYRFYIDMETGVGEQRVQKALATLDNWGYEVDILGSYKKAELPETAK
jgi:prephenate dehydratase